MKNGIFTLLVIILMYQSYNAGSISGVISYEGSSSETIYVAAFIDPNLENEPANMITLNFVGEYSLNDLVDGTYYIVSVISADPNQMKPTDPYGFWGTFENLTPIVIQGNNDITGIDINLVDGTEDIPNPFAEFYVEPNVIVQLPESTAYGISPAIVYNGEVIYLYKHDATDASSAKIHEINPETGELITTHYLLLQSLPNNISWIDKMVFRNGDLWATGGYGDPMGTGYIEGIFKVDISTSTSSNQIPNNSNSIGTMRGLACDGTNFYIGFNSFGQEGIVKFNPDDVTEIPNNLSISLDDQELESLTYGNGYLWIGIDKVNQFDVVTNEFMGILDLPAYASQLYIDHKFWMYDENDNTIKYYNDITVDVKNENNFITNMDYSLAQNYPNPFNPTTSISYSIPSDGFVSLSIYDILGNELGVLENGYISAGSYTYNFDASNLTSGIYFYTIRANNFVQTKKMLLMK